eukprot:1617125-Rhodomonas_salina.1
MSSNHVRIATLSCVDCARNSYPGHVHCRGFFIAGKMAGKTSSNSSASMKGIVSREALRLLRAVPRF